MPVDVMVLRFLTSNVSSVRRDIGSIGGDLGGLERQMLRTTAISGTVGAIGVQGFRMMANMTKSALDAAGQVERVENGYLTVLKNAQKAKELSAAVRRFDVEMPFDFLQSAKASQQLLAVGFRGKELLDVMYSVGNATLAAGRGVDTFSHALAVVSKIKSAGVLTGVRVNQFASFGINIKDILKKELGLTDEQMINIGRLKLKADVVIPALIKGLTENFGEAGKRAANSYLGGLEVLGGAKDKLFASVGKTILPEATAFTKQITEATLAVDKFVSAHPRVTKMALAMGFLGTSAMAIGGGIKIWRTAALVKGLLAAATDRDRIAESRKIPVALGEARAHQAAAVAAGEHAMANRMLGTGMLALPGPAGVAPGGAVGAAAQVGMMARMRALMAAPLFTPSMAVAMGKAGVPRMIGTQALGATLGSGLAAIGVGAAAGYGASDDYRTLGDDSLTAATKAMATGVTAAVASIFLPGALVPVVLATGFRYLFNRAVNVQLEKAATQGDGIKELEKGGQTAAQQAEAFDRSAATKRKQAQDILNQSLLTWMPGDGAKAKQLQDEADQDAHLARAARERVREENRPDPLAYGRRAMAVWAAERAREDEVRRRSGAPMAADIYAPGPRGSDLERLQESQRQEDARSAQVRAENEGRVTVGRITSHRNGARSVEIRLPAGPAERTERIEKLRRTTAMPDLVM